MPWTLGTMLMRQLLTIIIFLFLLLRPSAKAQKSITINPTGLYNFDGHTYKKNGDTYGYFGTIKVVRLDSAKILMSFYVCKGAPSYNSGSFVDTLNYLNNEAIYEGDTTMAETTCKLTFHFTSKGISAELSSDYSNSACGFGHAVDAQGFYKRVKGKIPTKNEILSDDE
jgi:hypothetical protein